MFVALESWEFAIIALVIAFPIVAFGSVELVTRRRRRRERLLATRDKTRGQVRR